MVPLDGNCGLAGGGATGGATATVDGNSGAFSEGFSIGATGSTCAALGNGCLLARRLGFGGFGRGWAASFFSTGFGAATGAAGGGGCNSARKGTGSSTPPNSSTSVPNRAAI